MTTTTPAMRAARALFDVRPLALELLPAARVPGLALEIGFIQYWIARTEAPYGDASALVQALHPEPRDAR